ncbi:MAG: GH25 family lysozyme [Prevotellaceae bacterium]|nr:GH25 family lysozyme [Prevotellaceae bacterium]MDY3365162.1 GH25 family lysozyme [Prevotella sp.]
MTYHKRRRRSKARSRWHWQSWLLGIFALFFVVFLVAVSFFPDLFRIGWLWIGGSSDNWSARSSRQERMDYDGIDVSRYQGKIDWSRVAADRAIQFVYIKATEGSTLVDPYYHRNMREANSYHLNVGSYHYVTSQTSIRSQFKSFTEAMSKHRQTLKPVLDIEADGVRKWSRKQAQDSLQLFVDLIKAKYGVTPIIYTYTNYYNKMLAPKFNRLHLFIAQYNKIPPVIKGVGRHNVWQHTDRGFVDGIDRPVDLNIFAEGTTLEDLLMPPGNE